jgi:hypothetical protein
MHHALRIASCGIHRSPTLLRRSPVCTRPTIAFSRSQQICIHFSSTDTTSAAKEKVSKDETSVPKNEFSSVRPLPPPPPRQKGTPPTISTHDIEEYIQPLYSRGWGLSPILPNGNGIAVLRKRFDFASAEALETFLAGLAEYEEKKQVCLSSSGLLRSSTQIKRKTKPTHTSSCPIFPRTFQHHAKTDVIEGQEHHAVLVSTWTHVARRPNADAQGKGSKTQGVTARDIRLAYALEELFESALVVSGREFAPRLRPKADRPQTVEELDGYS